ncbi:hypothetical protein L0938_07735 [Paracidovorax citrulli]
MTPLNALVYCSQAAPGMTLYRIDELAQDAAAHNLALNAAAIGEIGLEVKANPLIHPVILVGQVAPADQAMLNQLSVTADRFDAELLRCKPRPDSRRCYDVPFRS